LSSYETTSLLIHSSAKVGKSTLSTTAPPPICVLDAEGGWKYVREAGYRSGVPLRRIEWDPLQGPPPRYDGTWDFCHVMVRKWSTLTQAYQWLSHVDAHDFHSLVLDSVTESQRKLKMQLRGTEQLRIQDWGDLLVHMDMLIRSMRDLVLLPEPNPLRCVVFIAETEFKDGAWRPAMQGQIGRALPYWVDICGYLYTELTQDANGQSTGKLKKLLIGEGVVPSIIAGERVQGALPDVIDDPHITRMMTQVFGESPSSPSSLK
jgi:hypothetical protein